MNQDHNCVLAALASLSAGNGVLVVDDENRENEGDLIFPATSLNAEQMAMLIRECSGDPPPKNWPTSKVSVRCGQGGRILGRKTFTAEQIIFKLREIEALVGQGESIAGACRGTMEKSRPGI